jgi:hypothetical protein
MITWEGVLCQGQLWCRGRLLHCWKINKLPLFLLNQMYIIMSIQTVDNVCHHVC